MKDKLERFLHPTADMKKAIERNAKQDEDLSLVLRHIDKEKRMAIDQLSRKQETFKKEILRRRENVSKQLKVQFFKQGNVVLKDQPRPDEMERVNRVRRTLSCEETRPPSVVHQRAVLSKRRSLPASLYRSSDSDELSVKTESVSSPPGTTNASIRNRSVTHPKGEETPIGYNNKKNHSTQSAIRRHSDVTFPGSSNMRNTGTSRLLQRRRLTMHNLVRPGCEHEVETLIRL